MITIDMPLSDDYDTQVLNNITVTKMLDSLSSEERDLLTLWMAGSFTLEEIGRIIGQKYHQMDIKSSVIRYHRDKILRKLQQQFVFPTK